MKTHFVVSPGSSKLTDSVSIKLAPSLNKRRAFTLVELLVVVSIIGILIGILFPAAQAVRQAARRTQCLSNMRQLMLATLNYESSGNGFPAADNGKGGSYVLSLLSSLEQEYLADRFHEELAAGETDNDRLQELGKYEIETLFCPSAHSSEKEVTLANQGMVSTHYFGVAGPIGSATSSDGSVTYEYRQLSGTTPAGNIGLQGLFSPNKKGKFFPRRIEDIRDGTSNTFAFGEVSGFTESLTAAETYRSGWCFGAGYDSTQKVNELYSIKSISVGLNKPSSSLNNAAFGSNHPGGAQFALVDGSVHFVDQNVSLDILKTYSSIDKVEKPEFLTPF